MLQSAWSHGCSIFAYHTSSGSEEQVRVELADLYKQLAYLVMERVKEGPHA